jgi:hypothetical protein
MHDQNIDMTSPLRQERADHLRRKTGKRVCACIKALDACDWNLEAAEAMLEPQPLVVEAENKGLGSVSPSGLDAISKDLEEALTLLRLLTQSQEKLLIRLKSSSML